MAFVGCGGSAPAEEPATSGTDAATTDAPADTAAASDVEQTLVWNLGSDPKTIDPGLNAASDGGHVTNNTFEGLMREIDGKMEPAMAESYTVSDDGLVYTFKIREGAKWSDGQPVTANDFEYAWSRVVDPATASEYAWIFDEVNIASWKALDEKTFEVTLSSPTPYFVGLTAFYTFFPVRQDMVETAGEGAWATNPETAVSNGPFKVTFFQTGDRIILEPNEYYWRRDEVKLSKIEVLMIVDQATA
ncbi:MAG: peptide ABC transporter substrate-binding protein, partial [Clostridia bacterium]|nr:peptide ABC transporter substrate-binding protein [Clostridia bacterium]